MSKVLQFCCVLLLFSYPVIASPAPADKKPPRVTINEDDTPLDKVIRDTKDKINQKIQEKIRTEKEHGNQKSACEDQVNSSDDDGEKLHRVSKACHVPQFKTEAEKGKSDLEVPDSTKPDGKRVVGKKVKTKTRLYFDSPDQRAEFGIPPGQDVSRWDDFKYTGKPNFDMVGAPGSQAANNRVYSAMLPASEGINNDKDCIDRATGKRLGGYVLDEQGKQIKNPESCFIDDEASPLVLKQTLTSQQDGTCVHANGRVYSHDECEELNYTTLEELIDEDAPQVAGGPPVDGDQDGNVEDTPERNGNSVCAQHDRNAVVGSDGCDLTQAARKDLNQRAMNDDHIPPGKQKKIFKINDATGECDESAEGNYSCGQEPREIEFEETVELRCPPDGEYKDGECLVPTAGAGGLVSVSLLLAPAANGSPSSITEPAMMGFTFAPPVIEWGIKEQDNVCIFGFCFEIFYLRFGYEFGAAAGLRLPVQATITDIPSPDINAEQQRTLTASLEPADFKVKDYVSFCQKHDLDKDWWISDCNRFAFPEFLESLIPDTILAAGEKQGSEFVAQYTVFAGLQIRLFTIPVVNFAIDSSVNLPAMCTLNQIKKQVEQSPAEWLQLLANFGKSLADSKNLMTALEANVANCASFTTPWGYDAAGEPYKFPFAQASFDVPADCTREQIEGKVVKIGENSESKPMCTGLKATIYGATLGLGLQLVPDVYSDLIKAQASTSGDAAAYSQTLEFHQATPGSNPPQSIGPLTFNNYNPTTDKATITLDDFTYYLNRFTVQVNGLIELGGVLAFIGNIAKIPLVTLTFDGGDVLAIPIPQHPGTGPITVEVPVTNYALTVNATPDPLPVKPGTPAAYEVWVKNEGTVPDTIQSFKSELSNRPQSSAPFVFGISSNPDFDCTYAGKQYWGYPFDGVADDCYDAAGNLLTGRTEISHEPNTAWSASFNATSVANVPAHTQAATPVLLTVSPFRHPLTKPGLYPVRITADSKGARDRNLAPVDPSNVPRLGAEKIVLMQIESFFEPQLTLTPAAAAVKPRGSVTYTAEAANYGNDLDQFTMQAAFADSDSVGCTLTTNGRLPGCPYRALITRIDPATATPPGWTTIAQLDPLFPASGTFQPLQSSQDTLTITAPPDWAGMQNTVYEFTLTATSTHDTAVSPAKNEKTARFTILATKESMSRYVNLEVAEFMAQINQAAAQGISMRGIQPVMLHPVTMMTDKALQEILAGDLGSASKTLASAIKVMEAVDRMVNGAALPKPYDTDWKARSAVILTDLADAQRAQ